MTTRVVPIQYRSAVDALIADRLGVGIIEWYYWNWVGEEVGYTEVLRRLHKRTEPIKTGPRTPQQHTVPDTAMQQASFR